MNYNKMLYFTDGIKRIDCHGREYIGLTEGYCHICDSQCKYKIMSVDTVQCISCGVTSIFMNQSWYSHINNEKQVKK